MDPGAGKYPSRVGGAGRGPLTSVRGTGWNDNAERMDGHGLGRSSGSEKTVAVALRWGAAGDRATASARAHLGEGLLAAADQEAHLDVVRVISQHRRAEPRLTLKARQFPTECCLPECVMRGTVSRVRTVVVRSTIPGRALRRLGIAAGSRTTVIHLTAEASEQWSIVVRMQTLWAAIIGAIALFMEVG